MKLGNYELFSAYVTPAQKKALVALKRRGEKLQDLIREAIDIVIAKRDGRKQ